MKPTPLSFFSFSQEKKPKRSPSFLFTKKRSQRKSSFRESLAAPGFMPPQRLSMHAHRLSANWIYALRGTEANKRKKSFDMSKRIQ